MKNKIILLAVIGTSAIGLTACGQQDPNAACRDGFGPNAKAVGFDDDERFCVVGTQPVGEVEKQSFDGWQADD